MASARVLVPRHIAMRPPALGGQVHALQGLTMGTSWSVRLAGAAGLATAPIAQAIQRELDGIVAQMSPWEPGSDISRYNRAPAGSWHALPAAFETVLACGLAVARDSGGAFDPAAGALVEAWGFGPRHRHDEAGFEPPDGARAEAARAAGGWQRVQLEAGRVRQPGGLQLDLSAIAKGYAVDRVARLLRERFGLEDHLVEVGGELRGEGVKPDGQPWWVAVEAAPRWHDGAWRPDPDAVPTRVALHGLCIATSGDHRRFYRREGRHHPHTLDPRSGRPVAHGMALVTVLHESCMAADALSTALTVLGPDEGPAWADARGLAALFVVRDAAGRLRERASRAFADLL